jgi:hypothetical protein
MGTLSWPDWLRLRQCTLAALPSPGARGYNHREADQLAQRSGARSLQGVTCP